MDVMKEINFFSFTQKLENNTDGIIIVNRSGEIILANSSSRRMLDLSPSSLNETILQSYKTKNMPVDNSSVKELMANLSGGANSGANAVENVVKIVQQAKERLNVICKELVDTTESPQISCDDYNPVICAEQQDVSSSDACSEHLKGGKERVIVSISFPLKDAADKLVGVITILRNMTEVRQIKKLMPEVFLNISHELRTPLTVIKGSIDNLLQGVGGKLTKKQRNYLSQTRESAEKLIQQIEKLLVSN